MKCKILILIALYKREEITRICFDSLKELGLDVFCIVSEEIGERLAKEYGFQYAYTIDRPLSEKMNQGFEATKDLDYDYIIQLGSDDILNPKIFSLYKELIDNREPYFGIKECFYMEPSTRRGKFFKYDVNHPIGAGRMISKEVLEKVNYRMYPQDRNMGLDTESDVALIRVGYLCKILPTNQFPYVIDIKSEENIHTFDNVPGFNADYQDIKKYIPKQCVERLEILEGLTVESKY